MMAWGAHQHPSHYSVLGVSHDAALSEIRAAYRAALLRLHPDKAAGTIITGGLITDANFLSVQHAWEVCGCTRIFRRREPPYPC